MTAIINFFTGIIDVIKTAIDFLIGLIEDIVELVVMVGQSAAEIPKLFALVPAPVTASLVTVLAVVVLFKILGREG